MKIKKEHLHESVKADAVEYFLHYSENNSYKRPWGFTESIQEFLKDKKYEFQVDPLMGEDIKKHGSQISAMSYCLTLDQIIELQNPRIIFEDKDDAMMFKLCFW